MAKEKDTQKEIEDHIKFHEEIVAYNQKKAEKEDKKYNED